MPRSHLLPPCRLAGVAAVLLVAGLPATLAVMPRVAGATEATTAYQPVGPVRLADTRSGAGFTRVDASTIRVPVLGRTGVPGTAAAVALGVTATGTGSAGYVTASPSGTARPFVSQLTVTARGQTRSSSVVVPVGPDGAVELYASAPMDLVVDAYGAFVPAAASRAGRLQLVTPSRLLDTRTAGEPVAAATSRTVPLPAGVPADALALVVNLTVTESRSAGYLTVSPAGRARPFTSVLTTDGPGQTRAALAIVPVAADGFEVYASATGHAIVDLVGWFTGPSASGGADGLFVPALPQRLLDTRQGPGPVHPNGTVELPVSPGGAVLQAVTLTQALGPGFVTVYAAGTPRPWVSALNAGHAGDTITNLSVAQVSGRGEGIYSSAGTQVVVDLAGWFTGSPTTASLPAAPNDPPAPPALWCPAVARAAVVDRAKQRGWLCTAGIAAAAFPITTARAQPAPGSYRVYAKDRVTTSTFGGHFSYLDNFVAFTRGIYTGARIGFHAIPRDAAGRPFQPYATVGTSAWFGQSAGCIRVLPDQSQHIWNHLAVGDVVAVVS